MFIFKSCLDKFASIDPHTDLEIMISQMVSEDYHVLRPVFGFSGQALYHPHGHLSYFTIC